MTDGIHVRTVGDMEVGDMEVGDMEGTHFALLSTEAQAKARKLADWYVGLSLQGTNASVIEDMDINWEVETTVRSDFLWNRDGTPCSVFYVSKWVKWDDLYIAEWWNDVKEHVCTS